MMPDGSTNGRKQASNCSPGGRSFSNPIHERGQLSRSWQEAETSTAATGSVARFTLRVCVLKIIRAMELITILTTATATGDSSTSKIVSALYYAPVAHYSTDAQYRDREQTP
jgi:hypothetical protein